MLFDLIVADPAWEMRDKLKMKVKRSSAAKYPVLKPKDIVALDVKSIASDNAILALWVPSAMLTDGMEAMKNWGFVQKQTWIWVKTKISPLDLLLKKFRQSIYNFEDLSFQEALGLLKITLDEFDLNDILNFNLGRIFRQTHEICLIGTRGKVSSLRKDKSQRSVFIGPALPEHSEKPEEFQNRLDLLYPGLNKVELFARRDRPGYTCVGLECPSTMGEDIRDSLKRLQKV